MMSTMVKVKSEQKRELVKLNEKKMILAADMDPEGAEAALPSFMHEHNMVEPHQASPRPSPEKAPEAASATRSQPSVSETPVDQKVNAAREKMQLRVESQANKLRERAEKAEEERLQKKAVKDAEREKKESDKAEQKNSDAGQAAAFLTGLSRDCKKVSDAIVEAATCGMRPGFAREWRASLQALLKDLNKDKEAVTKVSTGEDVGLHALEVAKATGLRVKKELQNFRTAKNFSTAASVKTPAITHTGA